MWDFRGMAFNQNNSTVHDVVHHLSDIDIRSKSQTEDYTSFI